MVGSSTASCRRGWVLLGLSVAALCVSCSSAEPVPPTDPPPRFPPLTIPDDSKLAAISSFRFAEGEAKALGMDNVFDPIVGGNGTDWRDVRGGSPRDIPGESAVLGDLASLAVCGLPEAAGGNCVVEVGPETTCGETGSWHGNGRKSSVSIPPEWFARWMSCAPLPPEAKKLPPELVRGLYFGAQIVSAPGPRSGDLRVESTCFEEGVGGLSAGLTRLGEAIGRELYLHVPLSWMDGAMGLETARLPAHMLSLPEGLSAPEEMMMMRVLRARGRRAVVSFVGTDSEPARSSRVAQSLVWGASISGERSGLSERSKKLIEFGRANEELIGGAAARVGVVLSLGSWVRMTEGERQDSLKRLEVLLTVLSTSSIPHRLVLLPESLPRTAGGGDLENWFRELDVALLPQARYSDREQRKLDRHFNKGGRESFSLEVAVEQPVDGAVERPPEVVLGGRLQEIGARLVERGLAVEWSPGEDVVSSRQVVPAHGGVAFHFIKSEIGGSERRLFIPEKLLFRENADWFFHRQGETRMLKPEWSERGGKRGLEFVVPPFQSWGILETRVGIGPERRGKLRINGTNEKTVFLTGWGNERTADMALIFPEVLNPWPVSEPRGTPSSFQWKVGEDEESASFEWNVVPVSAMGSIVAEESYFSLELLFKNESEEVQRDVSAGLCLSPAGEIGFPPTFHERTWLIGSEGELRSLADMRVSSGFSPLYNETEQFSWPVVMEETVSRERSVAFAFEQSSGVGGNAWGASVCLHLEPSVRSLQPGESTLLRGAVVFVDGPVADAKQILAAAGWGGSQRRYRDAAPSGSFLDGLPERTPPPCSEMAQFDSAPPGPSVEKP